MPPKLQNRTFHIRQNNPHRLGTQADRSRDGTPPPIVSVAVGTAGYKRSWKWAMRMGEAGMLDRVQSLLMYDCNQKSIDDIDAETRVMRRERGNRLPVILPGYLPKVDGFLRDPNAFKDYYGLIHRDMERMVDTLSRRAEEVGSPPQIIMEWFGFGGHAKLGGVLHQMLLEKFPEAIFLPIILLPREHVLEENMRRETWAAYEETMLLPSPYSDEGDEFRGFPAVVTDNRIARDVRLLDDKLAIGLASLEASMGYKVDSGSLSETVNSFRDYSNGWFGMRVLSRRVDVTSTRASSRGWMGPFRPKEMVVVNDDAKQLTWETKKAMWDIVDPRRTDLDLAHHRFVETDAVMRMVVSMPVDASGLQEIERDVADQLDREDYSLAYPNLVWSFAPANFVQSGADRHMYITLFFPLQDGDIRSITDIMRPSQDDVPAHVSDGLAQTGFGTGHYLVEDKQEKIRTGHSQYTFTSKGREVMLERIARKQAAQQAQEMPGGPNGYNNGYHNGYSNGHEPYSR